MKTCMFLCFHVHFKHKSTKTCTFQCKMLLLLLVSVYEFSLLEMQDEEGEGVLVRGG